MSNSIILSGSASDIFIINISGSATLTGTEAFALTGGVSTENVLCNFTGSSGSLMTHIGDVINGIILAPNYNLTLDGAFNGEIIGGGAGNTTTLMSGAVVNGHRPNLYPNPAP